jgi:hypothetical protein
MAYMGKGNMFLSILNCRRLHAVFHGFTALTSKFSNC